MSTPAVPGTSGGWGAPSAPETPGVASQGRGRGAGRTPSARRRLVVGIVAAIIGGLLVLVAVGPLGFAKRFDGRVEVTGEVTQTVSAAEAGVPLALLEYQIAGSKHVGAVFGDFQIGEQLRVDVPPDGSVYQILYLTPTTATVVLSHLLAYAGLIILVLGSVGVVRGVRQRNREVTARVWATYGARLGVRPAGPPAPPATPPAPPSPLYAPYDLS